MNRAIAEGSVMEFSYPKKRTIAVTTTDSTKRGKIDIGKVLVQSRSSEVQLIDQCPSVASSPEKSTSPAVSGTSDHVPLSMSSSNQSNEVVKDDQLESLDLKTGDLESDIFMLTNGGFSREPSPSTEVEPDEMEHSTNKKPSQSSSCRKPAPSKMPSAAELEEFFSVAEKYEQKRFADKYNYDIVKDVPLEGRYQWVLLKQ